MDLKPAVLAVTALTALILAGCRADRPEAGTTPLVAPPSAVTPTPAPTPTPTASTIPLAVTLPPKIPPVLACRKAAKLVAAGITITGDFADNPTGSATNVTEVYDTAQAMRDLQPSMPGTLADNLGRYADMLDSLGMAVNTGILATIETGVAKTETYEIIIGCGKYVKAHS